MLFKVKYNILFAFHLREQFESSENFIQKNVRSYNQGQHHKMDIKFTANLENKNLKRNKFMQCIFAKKVHKH